MTDDKNPSAPAPPAGNRQPGSQGGTAPGSTGAAGTTPTPPGVAGPAPGASPRPAGAAAARPAGGGAKGAGPAAPMTRRGFLSVIGVAWSAFAAACGAGAIATTRFMFPNVLFEPPQTFKAGVPSEFLPGTVDNRFKESFGVFIVRNEGRLYALKAVCTHLGCTPNWLEEANKFKCPCHGSGFYRTGINYEGPAPRPLERYRVVLADDGQILIDKTRSYAYEKGEWSNPESFLTA